MPRISNAKRLTGESAPARPAVDDTVHAGSFVVEGEGRGVVVAIGADTRIPGPAIIEQVDTTTLVEPGWTARLGEGGALIIEKDAA